MKREYEADAVFHHFAVKNKELLVHLLLQKGKTRRRYLLVRPFIVAKRQKSLATSCKLFCAVPLKRVLSKLLCALILVSSQLLFELYFFQR